MPWRNTKEPYFIWISEILLQQTQVKQALPYYNNFIKKFPTLNTLAESNLNSVLKSWEGLGYYSRARNLHTTAIYICDTLKGNFPKSYEELIKLKGIGDYTASAIASICYGEEKAVLDGNVFRLFSRLFEIYTPINSTEGQKEFKKIAIRLLDKKNVGDYNQAIMEYGATVCKKNPICSICIFKQDCLSYKNQVINLLPAKIKPKPSKIRYFNYIIFLDKKGNTFIQKRKKKDIWEDLYEFYLIETSETCSPNYIKKQLEQTFSTLTISNLEKYQDLVTHILSHQKLIVQFWLVLTRNIPLDNVKISFKSVTKYAKSQLITTFLKKYSSRIINFI